MLNYLARLPNGKLILWCYLIWYLVVVHFHFDPSPKIWINALGISAIIGTGLRLSVATPGGGRTDPWQVFRLYMMPFGVSSFSALIKGQGFVLIFSPDPGEVTTGIGACLGLVLATRIARMTVARR